MALSKFNSIINILISEAKKSDVKYHHLAACILDKKKIVDKPYANISRTCYHGDINSAFHAEARALLRFFGKDIIFKSKWTFNDEKTKNSYGNKNDLIVIRVGKDNTLCNSRPCFNCLSMMKTLNIRRVYYVNNNNDIIYEYVKNMISIHISNSMAIVDAIKNKNRKNNLYQDILKKMFPTQVRKLNFEIFMEHNFNIIIYNYKIEYIDKVKYVVIFDNNKNIIIKSIFTD